MFCDFFFDVCILITLLGWKVDELSFVYQNKLLEDTQMIQHVQFNDGDTIIVKRKGIQRETEQTKIIMCNFNILKVIRILFNLFIVDLISFFCFLFLI
jgi:hypothetical protein